MKQLIYTICAAFLISLFSCSQEEMVMESVENETKTCSIPFSLSIEGDAGFSILTRAQDEPVNTGEYTVKMYLFKENADGKYILDREPVPITTSLYSIENIDVGAHYAYLFVAVPKDYASVLNNARDFGTFAYTGETPEFNYSQPIAYSTDKATALDNCFIPFFEEDTQENGEANDWAARDLEIFGDGNYITAGLAYHTPIDLTMKRQVGVVEIQLTGINTNDKITCSIQSDYYRIYFSQMIKNSTTSEYSSQNSAVSGTVGDDGTANDYFSITSQYILQETGTLPTFTKIVTADAKDIENGNYNLQIVLPYTTAFSAEKTGTVPDVQKANYNRNSSSVTGSMTLTMPDGKQYTYTNSYPIHRNTKTTFYIEGTKLTTKFGDSGIDLDDDEWDGVTK